VDKHSEVVVALAAVSSFLWLLWIDHTSQIYKIAAYIGLRLAPRLRDRDAGLLGWEHFMRILNQGGEKAAIALRRPSEEIKLLRTESIGRFVSLLFGVTPLLLIVGFIIAKYGFVVAAYRELLDYRTIPSLRGWILVLAFSAWIYALI
jgi:hypothetical protein